MIVAVYAGYDSGPKEEGMNDITEKLLSLPQIGDDPLCARMVPLVTRPTGLTSAGYPYFERRTFEQFRDTIPYLFATGCAVLDGLRKIEEAIDSIAVAEEIGDNAKRGCRVAGQMTRTAAITAPTDLWLMRHIIGVHSEFGLTDRLLEGEAIHPEFCRLDDGRWLDAEQLATDLHFLLARGIVEQYDESFRVAGHVRARQLLSKLGDVPEGHPVPATPLWRKLFESHQGDEALSGEELESLGRLGRLQGGIPTPRRKVEQNHWLPTVDEVRIGYLLVPLVLGLRAAGLCTGREVGDEIRVDDLASEHGDLAGQAVAILVSAGWLDGDEKRVTRLGARGFSRAPGPFGIIQTYHPYMAQARDILLKGRSNVWVRRGENIGASQDANRKTFKKANDALDRFCEDTGFDFRVFIEHAIGRGEATRQRFERQGEDNIRYFGADLEDPAIDAAEEEQANGRLPQNMVFVRRADIGTPDKLLRALEREGAPTSGAVMLVGNGFHEVRDQTDQKMVEVFRGYHEAGIILLFTEENALSVDDLRATAWNTYHAGFKYVHEKSGQCLRPASPRPRPRLGPPLRAAWSECARMAGYVRADEYCARTRTIYPYARRHRHNPSISVNHFFVPRPIAEKLGIPIPETN